MINTIINLLTDKSDISAWKITEQETESKELFFIKKKLDMNRAKNVCKYHLTIYKDFEEDGEKFRGSANTDIPPTMSEKEIKVKIDESLFAAGFVKNKWYPIAEKSTYTPDIKISEIASNEISKTLPAFIQAIFEEDRDDSSFLNSCELFIEKIKTRIVNSAGVDVEYIKSKGMLEIVAQSNLGEEEVELFKIIEFSDSNYDYIKSEVKKLIDQARQRSSTKTIPTQKDLPILLSGDAVKDFLEYYVIQSSAKMVYDGISKSKPNEAIHKEKVTGDTVSISVIPQLNNSSLSSPYDADGFPLKNRVIIENGILKNYIASLRYASYLNCKATGSIANFEVSGGNSLITDLKKEPYLEAIAFSDFQMEPMSGDFGGEIRLGIWFDGEKTTRVSGCSITGNIKKSGLDMKLSKEVTQLNNYKGPALIQLHSVNIAGD